MKTNQKQFFVFDIIISNIMYFFFDFINVSTTFQNFINRILTIRFDINVIIYLNDIIIYSMNVEIHVDDIK